MNARTYRDMLCEKQQNGKKDRQWVLENTYRIDRLRDRSCRAAHILATGDALFRHIALQIRRDCEAALKASTSALF